jgi:hypothetical protein
MLLDETILIVGFALISVKWFAGLLAFSLQDTVKVAWLWILGNLITWTRENK